MKSATYPKAFDLICEFVELYITTRGNAAYATHICELNPIDISAITEPFKTQIIRALVEATPTDDLSNIFCDCDDFYELARASLNGIAGVEFGKVFRECAEKYFSNTIDALLEEATDRYQQRRLWRNQPENDFEYENNCINRQRI